MKDNECFPEKQYNSQSDNAISWFNGGSASHERGCWVKSAVSITPMRIGNTICIIKKRFVKPKIAANDNHINSSANPIKIMWQIIKKIPIHQREH